MGAASCFKFYDRTDPARTLLVRADSWYLAREAALRRFGIETPLGWAPATSGEEEEWDLFERLREAKATKATKGRVKRAKK